MLHDLSVRWMVVVVLYGSTGIVAGADETPNPVGRAAADLNVTRVNRSDLVRLPPVSPDLVINHDRDSADGTWRQEGEDLIIELDGKQLRLRRSASFTESIPSSRPARPAQSNTGEVYGRLSHKCFPLADSQVALVPLTKTWLGYKITGAVEPIKTTTDRAGVYHFAGVSPGLYKLKWRPAGQDSWIRRAEIRPDVRVRTNETSHVKEISVALRTIN